MNVSLPVIERPIATTLLSIGIFLVGAVAYNFLPVAADQRPVLRAVYGPEHPSRIRLPVMPR